MEKIFAAKGRILFALGVFASMALVLSAQAACREVATGETVNVDDTNVSGFADGFSFADDTGRIVFTTSVAPAMDISGGGTVVKAGGGAWVMTKPIPGFTGEFRIEEGSVRPADGATSATYYGDAEASVLTVADGATVFVHPSSADAGTGTLGKRLVRIAGSGFDGQGAICVDRDVSSTPFTRISLDADARISFPVLGYQDTRIGAGGVLDLNGHELVKTGYGSLYVTGVVTNMGGIVCAASEAAGANNLNTLCFYDSISFYPAPGKTLADCPISLGNTSCLMFNWCTMPIPLPVNVAENAIVQVRASSNCPLADTNCCTFAGAVTVGAGAELQLTTYGTSSRHVQFTGPVSGAGKIVSLSSEGGRYYILGENHLTSDYTFSMSSALSPGSLFSSLTLGSPLSLPRNGTLTVNGGWVCLRLAGDGGEGWTASEIGDYMRSASFGSSMTMVAVDLTGREDAEIAAAELGDVSGFAHGIGMWGPGKTLSLTGALAMPEATAGAIAGTLRFTGEGKRTVKKLCIGGYDQSITGAVEVVDGAEVEVKDVFDLGGRENAVGILRVRNAKFTDTSSSRVNIATVKNAVGIVDVREGAEVEMRMLPASHLDSRCGAVYVSGGSFSSPGSVYIGHLSHGYLEVDGGTFTAEGGLNVSNGGNSDGIVRLKSGKIEVPAGNSLMGGSSGNNTVHLCLSGGVLENGSGQMQFPCNNTGDTVAGTLSMLTLENDALMVVTNAGSSVLFCTQPRSTGICNLNGGTLLVNSVRALSPEDRPDSSGYLNLNGGTIKVGDSVGSMFSGWKRVTVFPGGLTIDTAGHDVWQGAKPLLKPEGGGVLEVPWTPEGGYVSTPQVRIEGDGEGACALAEFDRHTGQVTSIRVISPGNGYTWAKARVWEGRKSSSDLIRDREVECLIGTVPATGGLVKKGEGQLSLSLPNTYCGDTVLAGGTLKVELTADAIPAGSRIVLAGGKLDMSGFPAPKKWAVDCAVPSVRYDGVLTFPEGADLEVRNFDPESDANLVLLTAEEIVGLPSVSVSHPRWAVHVSRTAIKLMKRRGLSVHFR